MDMFLKTSESMGHIYYYVGYMVTRARVYVCMCACACAHAHARARVRVCACAGERVSV